jgi:hypothetical protein
VRSGKTMGAKGRYFGAGFFNIIFGLVILVYSTDR